MRRAASLVCAALFGLPSTGTASESLGSRTSWSVFSAVMTDDRWEDVLWPSSGIETRDSYLLGGSLSREWSMGSFGFAGVESGLYRHAGEQDLWEISVPLYVRSQRPEPGYIPNLALGLGLSYTSRVPEVEVDRKGESQNLLLAWFIELEFRSHAQTRPYFRLHHRSDGFGFLDVDSGSNAVGIGLRRDF